MTYSITQNGKPLDKSKYTIDTKNKTFSTEEKDLVLDFSNKKGWSFITGSYCTFKTDYYCTFKTGYGCTFKTGYCCTFKTDSDCTFKTGGDCAFNTGSHCTFNIFHSFKSIETKGNSTILIRDKKILDTMEDEVIIYFDENNSKLLYTENKVSKEIYLTVKELVS